MAIETQPLIRLLEFHPDLGADLQGPVLDEAQRLVACPELTLEPGPWDPAELPDFPALHGRVLGCLVVEGLLVREVFLSDRVSTTLHGPRDLVAVDDLGDVSLPVESRFSVAVPSRLALLDDRFLAAARRWPWLAGRLIDGMASQIGRGAVHQAVSQLPRVEDRLIALFWHLADRWGHVRTDGIAIDLPLTHEALGRLVGARRPTVSLGLQVLAERGALQRQPDASWLLSPASIEILARDGYVAEPLRPVVAGRGSSRRTVAPLKVSDRRELLNRLHELRAIHSVVERRTTEVLNRNRAIRAQLAQRRVALADSDGGET